MMKMIAGWMDGWTDVLVKEKGKEREEERCTCYSGCTS